MISWYIITPNPPDEVEGLPIPGKSAIPFNELEEVPVPPSGIKVLVEVYKVGEVRETKIPKIKIPKIALIARKRR